MRISLPLLYDIDESIRFIIDDSGVSMDALTAIGVRATADTVLIKKYIAYYLTKNINYNLTLGEIGKMIGGKDHATVMYYNKDINGLADMYPSIRMKLAYLAHMKHESKPQFSEINTYAQIRSMLNTIKNNANSGKIQKVLLYITELEISEKKLAN